MRKNYLMAGLALATMTGFVACSDDDDPSQEPEKPVAENVVVNGAFFLNQGNYSNKIEGSLNVLNYANSTMFNDVFKEANGRSLGSTPQCGLEYGGKIYLGMYESNTIEIIDRYTYESVKQISLEGSVNGQEPRSMVADGGKVYISMYDGYVARLDTASHSIEASVKVGPNPEVIGIYKNKLYVPNSDGMNYQVGYGETASVIDMSSFTVESTIDVPLNPYKFFTVGDNLYLLAKGNYYDVASTVSRLEDDGSFTELFNATIVSSYGNNIYYIDAPWGGTTAYGKYDTTVATSSSLPIENIDSPSEMGIDPNTGRMFISSYPLNNGYADYNSDGYVCEYDLNGVYKAKYDIGGGAPCIFFVK